MAARARRWAAALAGCALAACGQAADDAVVCSTGRMVGTSENEDMAPGQTCIACHALTNSGGDGMEAPSFAFAGTVYTRSHEPDGCAGGLVGATGGEVEIDVKSATGEHVVAAMTPGGNFMLEAAGIALPITATVRYQGRTREMATPAASGDCNRCHTVDGDSGAPGRITLP